MNFFLNTVVVCLGVLLIADPAHSAGKNALLDPYVLADKLPIRFEGHDIANLLAALQKRPVKDQFEKTLEYEARLVAWRNQPFFGRVKPDDRLALVAEMMMAQPKADYDADAGMMTLETDPGCANSHGVQLRLWTKKLMKKGHHTRMAIGDVCLVFTRRSGPEGTVSIPIPREDARFFSLQGGVLYVGHLNDDPLQIEHHESAEIDLLIYTISMDMEQIVYFDPRTGRVFAKIAP